jgi:hypothetical protein
MPGLRGDSSRTLSGETCPASAGGDATLRSQRRLPSLRSTRRLRSRRRGGRKRPTGPRAGVSNGRSSEEVPVMGMKRRVRRKDKTRTHDRSEGHEAERRSRRLSGQGTLWLGGGPHAAGAHAGEPATRMGTSPWHMARTLATQSGMTNAWLESQGLVSVRTLWIAFHYPASNLSGLPAPAAG